MPTASPSGSYVAGNMVSEDSDEYKEVMQDLVDEGFLPEIPTSPSGQSYSYLATEDGGQAVFAAALNNEDSNSNANSCDYIDNTVTYSNCQKDAFSCEETDEYACFDASTYSQCDTENMTEPECNTEAPDGIPQEICDAHYGYSSGSESCAVVLLATPWQCEKTVSGVCSGGSNSDYCSCM